jgi:hypothetical protein
MSEDQRSLVGYGDRWRLKLSFVDAIRETGATCNAAAVIFFYGIFEGSNTGFDHGIQLLRYGEMFLKKPRRPDR